MIARDYQGKGFGKQTLDMVTDKVRKDGNKYLFTSCGMEEVSPYLFYLKYGFEDTGRTFEDEQVLKLKL